MKTPREILLSRHKEADAKLDQIRRAVVADLTPRPTKEPEISFVLKLWRELVWPCRRTWAGLAATWLAILVFNHSQSGSGPAVVAGASAPPAEIRLAWREQHRVLEEILGAKAPVTPAEPPRHPNNQPRSERHLVALA